MRNRFIQRGGRLLAGVAGASLLVVALGGCAQTAAPEASPAPIQYSSRISGLRLIGLQRIPLKYDFNGTVIGGLSGIDYRPAEDAFIAESDDKSEYGPARFYTFRLDYDQGGFRLVTPVAVALFRQKNGTVYPDKKHVKRGDDIPDLESIRSDPSDGTVWYASEGDRALRMNPFVRHATVTGDYLGELPMPAQFQVHPEAELGPRHNLSFEGLSFSRDGKTLWLAMEAPLYEDGPLTSVQHGAYSRVTQFDRAGQMLAQYAYPIEPIAHAPAAGKNADNGVSEMLTVSETEFLTLERSGVQEASGVYHYYIKLFDVQVAGATDIKSVAALTRGGFTPLQKRLLLDFNTLGQPWVDNIEGMTWGRQLTNGHASLVFVSDDNFTDYQQNQFWVFEVLP